MIDTEFILAGKAIFTVKVGPNSLSAASPHYTFKVKRKEGDLLSNTIYFISILTGPDNESSYTYIGVLDPINGWVRLTAKSRYTENCVPVKIVRRVLERIWKNEGHVVEAAGWEVYHRGQCGKCGRTLTVPESIESGIGPECAKHLNRRKLQTQEV